MSNSYIDVDLDSFNTGFPKDMPVPSLLLAFGKWLKNIPHGTLGYFDSLDSEPMPEVFIPNNFDKNAIETISSKIGIFLHLGDGSMLALWNYGDKAPAVVLIGSEGELDNVASSLESFLIAFSKGKTGINDLDDDEASASRADLAQWLTQQKVKTKSAKVPNFQEWFAEFELTPPSSNDVQENIIRKQTIDKDANYKEYKAWIDLFGRKSDDPNVQHALAQVGVTEKIKLDRGDSSANFQSKDTGMMIVFTDVYSLYEQPPFKSNTSILSGIILFIQDKKEKTYKGPLPYDLKLVDAQTILRSRFGEPEDSDEDFFWDEWKLSIDKLKLRVSYTKDYQSIKTISLNLLRIKIAKEIKEKSKADQFKHFEKFGPAPQDLISQIESLIGRFADDPAVITLCNQLGFDIASIKSADRFRHLARADQGFSLEFEWPWNYNNKKLQETYPPAVRKNFKKRMLLSIEVVNEGYRNWDRELNEYVYYTAFKGNLPCGISFQNTLPEVKEIMSKKFFESKYGRESICYFHDKKKEITYGFSFVEETKDKLKKGVIERIFIQRTAGSGE